MAKEDDLKILELKVTVNCCEGCKRKVLKALSIKGVLKVEIHPVLPKVTVHGSVDVQTLIKKLAKCGKMAELWPSSEMQKPPKDDKKPAKTSAKEIEATTSDEKKKVKEVDSEKTKLNPETSMCCDELDKTNQDNSTGEYCYHEKKASKCPPKETFDGVESPAPEVPKCIFPTVVTTIPPVNYVVNSNMMQSPATMMASQAQVYYPVQSYTVPMAFYTVSGQSPPPPYIVRDSYHYDPRVYHPPPAPSQASGLADYFNDENTAGCNVM